MAEKSKENSSSNVAEFDFTQKSRWTDLQLEVEEKTLYVPKSYLVMMSPVFQRMFESDFMEKDLNVLPLPGKKYDDVLTFLQCSMPRQPMKIAYDKVLMVLPLAHEYQVTSLLDRCCDCLIEKLGDTYNHKLSYVYAQYAVICGLGEKFGFKKVVDKCLELFSQNMSRIYRDLPAFIQLSEEIQLRILRQRLATID